MANKDKTNKNLVIDNTVKVKKTAVSMSSVAGNPQNARIAVLNAANQTIYLSASDTNAIQDGGFFVNGPVIVEGDSYQKTVTIDESLKSGSLDIESVWVQNDSAAEFILNMIAASYDMSTNSITIKAFGNPLIQIGDLAKVNCVTYKIDFPESQYWVVSSVSHSFDTTLSTTVVLKPLSKLYSIIDVAPPIM